MFKELIKNKTNEEEAKQVIEKIKEITSSNKILTIGIATFNIHQRELIKDYIREIRFNHFR